MPYSDFIPAALVPRWMRTTWWVKYWSTIGAQLDTFTAATKSAVAARFPSTKYASSDSLNAIGGDRQLQRGLSGNETDAAYAPRLQNAWNTWTACGTPLGLLNALAIAGYPTAIIETAGGIQYTLSGGNLVITNLPEVSGLLGMWLMRWSRYYWAEFSICFLTPNLPETSQGAASNWASALPATTSAEIQTLVNLIELWKPGFTRCAGITVISAGRCYGLPLGLTYGGLSGAGYAYSGNSVFTYPVEPS